MFVLLCAVPLVWAAITDLKRRIIPDWTWIVLLLIGIASAFLLPSPALYERIAGFFLPGICLLLLAVRYGGVGGGDIKLSAAVGFTFGLNALAVILLFTLIPACIYARAKRQRSVPLATFLCIGVFYTPVLFIYPDYFNKGGAFTLELKAILAIVLCLVIIGGAVYLQIKRKKK